MQIFDVIVVGGGIVGASLALALRTCDAGRRLGVVEPRDLRQRTAAGWDSRIYALSPGNARWLDELGVWQKMPAVARDARRVHAHLRRQRRRGISSSMPTTPACASSRASSRTGRCSRGLVAGACGRRACGRLPPGASVLRCDGSASRRASPCATARELCARASSWAPTAATRGCAQQAGIAARRSRLRAGRGRRELRMRAASRRHGLPVVQRRRRARAAAPCREIACRWSGPRERTTRTS